MVMRRMDMRRMDMDTAIRPTHTRPMATVMATVDTDMHPITRGTTAAVITPRVAITMAGIMPHDAPTFVTTRAAIGSQPKPSCRASVTLRSVKFRELGETKGF